MGILMTLRGFCSSSDQTEKGNPIQPVEIMGEWGFFMGSAHTAREFTEGYCTLALSP